VDLVGTRDLDVPLVAVEELLKWEGVDAVITLGVVGRHDLVRLLIRSAREVDRAASPVFLDQLETLSHDYEENYIARIVGLMEIYEKPVIGVSMARTDQGTVRQSSLSRLSL
jgi:6,7-dimethyl-8-ribityllumazine synthase